MAHNEKDDRLISTTRSELLTSSSGYGAADRHDGLISNRSNSDIDAIANFDPRSDYTL